MKPTLFAARRLRRYEVVPRQPIVRISFLGANEKLYEIMLQTPGDLLLDESVRYGWMASIRRIIVSAS